jgi:hypothetical protein
MPRRRPPERSDWGRGRGPSARALRRAPRLGHRTDRSSGSPRDDLRGDPRGDRARPTRRPPGRARRNRRFRPGSRRRALRRGLASERAGRGIRSPTSSRSSVPGAVPCRSHAANDRSSGRTSQRGTGATEAAPPRGRDAGPGGIAEASHRCSPARLPTASGGEPAGRRASDDGRSRRRRATSRRTSPRFARDTKSHPRETTWIVRLPGNPARAGNTPERAHGRTTSLPLAPLIRIRRDTAAPVTVVQARPSRGSGRPRASVVRSRNLAGPAPGASTRSRRRTLRRLRGARPDTVTIGLAPHAARATLGPAIDEHDVSHRRPRTNGPSSSPSVGAKQHLPWGSVPFDRISGGNRWRAGLPPRHLPLPGSLTPSAV